MKTTTLIAMLMLLASGCTTTRHLWEKPVYQESLTGFYWADKENQLIATGRKFAYAATVDEELKKAIDLHDVVSMRMRLFNTEVDRNNNFHTTLVLFTNKRQQDLAEGELTRLADAGFTQKGSAHGLSLVKSVTGTRYILEGEPKKSTFDKPYVVEIQQPHTYSSTAKKMIATPFAIAYDTFVVVPKAIFVMSIMAFDSYGTGNR